MNIEKGQLDFDKSLERNKKPFISSWEMDNFDVDMDKE